MGGRSTSSFSFTTVSKRVISCSTSTAVGRSSNKSTSVPSVVCSSLLALGEKDRETPGDLFLGVGMMVSFF